MRPWIEFLNVDVTEYYEFNFDFQNVICPNHYNRNHYENISVSFEIALELDSDCDPLRKKNSKQIFSC